MRREWAGISALLCACAGTQVAQPKAVPQAPVEPVAATSEKAAPSAMKAKTYVDDAPSCRPTGADPKVVSHESSASDSAETGIGLVFEVAGIALEFPACTPEADVRVITTSWETAQRPSPAAIDAKFTRHAATLRVDQSIAAAESTPILARLHSKRELTKPGEKLVLAVESSGECDPTHKKYKLDDGGCSHWALYDTYFDPTRSEMVAAIPNTGGYRLQFGWVPAK
ncbi:MAG TPA: hypothetical protein VFX59_23030 [Polyangiales bacterium]|nr:hypothetical protein [Polyangiales bacterium]